MHGLSPLARGTLNSVGFFTFGARFIPAGAGNTYSRLIILTSCAVYPRWRGEHTILYFANGDQSGLSPLARGTPDDIADQRRAARFIPAGAGNTTGKKAARLKEAVYPRWRGEHIKGASTYGNPVGLSPLARGTLSSITAVGARLRFIPAGAGNTAGRGKIRLGDAVYPRWRGEHATSSPAAENPVGLSPLARGTH